MSGHTKGPWRVEHKDNYIPDDWQEAPTQVVSEDGTVIACNTAFYPTALDPANARLIAAAPTMADDIDEFMRRLGPRWFLEQGWFPASLSDADHA